MRRREAEGDIVGNMDGGGTGFEGTGWGIMPEVSCKDETGEETPSGTARQGREEKDGDNWQR